MPPRAWAPGGTSFGARGMIVVSRVRVSDGEGSSSRILSQGCLPRGGIWRNLAADLRPDEGRLHARPGTVGWASLQALTPLFDPTFSKQSQGFRPGKRAHPAVEAARGYLEEGA